MVRTIIIDDERLAVSELQNLLQNEPDINLVGIAADIHESLQVIRQFQPDLVFLDLLLQQHSGFEVLEAFPERTFDTIVITAHSRVDLTLQGYEYGIIDYLLKPISPIKLKRSIERVVAKQKKEAATIVVHDRWGNFHRLAVDNIVYCKAHGKHSIIQCRNQQLSVIEPLETIEQCLVQHNFCRSHRSYLVHLRDVFRVTNTGIVVGVDNSTETLVLAARRRSDFLKRWKLYGKE